MNVFRMNPTLYHHRLLAVLYVIELKTQVLAGRVLPSPTRIAFVTILDALIVLESNHHVDSIS